MERSSPSTSENLEVPLNLRKRLEEMRHQMGMTQKQMALKLGISAPYLNEIITGKKSGHRKIIDFARRLDISVEHLTGERLLIPLVAELTATEPIRCDDEGCLDFIDISHLPGIARETARNCYALRVCGNSMIPFQKDGDLLIVEKNSHEKIRSGDKVIFHHRRLSSIRYVESMDELLILRPLNLNLPSEAENKARLLNLDKVIYIIPS
jgi:SOS-response transcriptional repressor LexA